MSSSNVDLDLTNTDKNKCSRNDLSSPTSISPSSSKRNPTPAFLEKLFDILEENNLYAHLISWQPDGNSFIIKKVNEFSEVVLPKYFKHSNIQSYIRQLNMYGFSKTRHDSSHHEFTHKLFQRGRRDLLSSIRRKTQNPRGTISNSSYIQYDDTNNNKSNKNDYQSYIVDEEHLSEDGTESPQTSSNSNSSSSINNNYLATIAQHEHRIKHLETQLLLLYDQCFDLTQKHNELCLALQKDKKRLCSNCSSSFNTDSSTMSFDNFRSISPDSLTSGSVKRLSSFNQVIDSQLLSGQPLKKIHSCPTNSSITCNPLENVHKPSESFNNLVKYKSFSKLFDSSLPNAIQNPSTVTSSSSISPSSLSPFSSNNNSTYITQVEGSKICVERDSDNSISSITCTLKNPNELSPNSFNSSIAGSSIHPYNKSNSNVPIKVKTESTNDYLNYQLSFKTYVPKSIVKKESFNDNELIRQDSNTAIGLDAIALAASIMDSR